MKKLNPAVIPPRPIPQVVISLIKLERGMVFEIMGVEHVCTVVENDSAIVRARVGERIRLVGNQAKASRILRIIDSDEIENFLSRRSVLDENQTSNGEHKTESNNMAKQKNTSNAGFSKFVQSLFDSGVKKSEAAEKAATKYPKTKDGIWFTAIWERKEEKKKNPKAASAPKKPTAAKGAKSKPAKKGKSAKPAKTAKAAKTPPPRPPSSTPPPRAEAAPTASSE